MISIARSNFGLASTIYNINMLHRACQGQFKTYSYNWLDLSLGVHNKKSTTSLRMTLLFCEPICLLTAYWYQYYL